MNVLFVGDVFGRPGRVAVEAIVPRLREARSVEFCIANAENAAGGFGLTRETSAELFAGGVDCLTGGNHLWDKKEIHEFIDSDTRILRPANYPPQVPGVGAALYGLRGGGTIAVLHLVGRVYMKEVDCPFRCADSVIQQLRQRTPVIIVDFHAEATSEKRAMGWYLDGRVSALVGTHTHVQTADEEILPGGTAYITDVGMTGPFQSVIGVQKEQALRRFLTQLPERMSPAVGDTRLSAVLLTIDEKEGKALSIKRIQLPYNDQGLRKEPGKDGSSPNRRESDRAGD